VAGSGAPYLRDRPPQDAPDAPQPEGTGAGADRGGVLTDARTRQEHALAATAGSVCEIPVVDENSRPVEKARLEILQRLLCS
jgi:hypothetical protein